MTTLIQELEDEIYAIADYWMQHTVDAINDGFYGRIDGNNQLHETAMKGAVLNARILWAFSAAYGFDNSRVQYKQMAQRAFDYIVQHFIDPIFGGVYWALDHKGQPLIEKKQIYAQAFIIYALAEYYKISKEPGARDLAIELFKLIEKYSFDHKENGYLEAFSRTWESQDDLRLSGKDRNEKKTMNTHLHIIEAYTNLYAVWADDTLKLKIINLLDIFELHFIDKRTGHLHLFFDEKWDLKSQDTSFGHDIEASWLLLQSAEAVGDINLIDKYKKIALQIATATLEGLDQDGGLWNEYNGHTQQWVKEKHWWPQAEALVGFISAWQLSNEERFKTHALNSWSFIKDFILDKQFGEWRWGVDAHYVALEEDKVGLWKCPYHNLRSCMEASRRMNGSKNRDSDSALS